MTPARLALLLALLPMAAGAQLVALGPLAADPTAPVEVESGTLSVDQGTGAAVFAGGVTVGQGDLRLQAEEVEVRYDERGGRIARLLASGGVTLATPTEAALDQVPAERVVRPGATVPGTPPELNASITVRYGPARPRAARRARCRRRRGRPRGSRRGRRR